MRRRRVAAIVATRVGDSASLRLTHGIEPEIDAANYYRFIYKALSAPTV
jgi:hypothetical protein